jgi:tRNA threonylcarbamoyl adenosine modification protein (Sua5/YciO/YrdC/YwlC family)
VSGSPVVERFERCIRAGGVVVFPSDTVYGLACHPDDPEAVRRLYELKGRPPAKAAAVMFFDLHAALAALGPLGPRTRTALHALMPGGVTVLLENPGRLWPLACAGDPDTLGLRVVDVPALAGAGVPVLQSSANLSGGHDARTLADVAEVIRAGADLVVDGGELPGTSSSVVDLRGYEESGTWKLIRPGAVSEEELSAALDRPPEHQHHFHPDTYKTMIRDDIPAYESLQDAVVAAAGGGPVRRILELGTGTGETARRLLERFGEARLVGVDESQEMLGAAAKALPSERVELRVARLEEPLPTGPFELVATALCVHHLEDDHKADLFRRVGDVLVAGGRFVLGDVVVPGDPAAAKIPLSPGYDKPSSVGRQLEWLMQAGFEARIAWQQDDMVVIVAEKDG